MIEEMIWGNIADGLMIKKGGLYFLGKINKSAILEFIF